MNIPFSKTCIAFVLSFLCQLSFGMENPAQKITIFSLLAPEMQVRVMRFSDNYVNIQQTNKDWYSEISIKKPKIFDYCTLDNDRLKLILFIATYKKNYEGVKNILQTKPITTFIQNNQLYYELKTDSNGNKKILDPCSIAKYNNDEKMLSLLKKNKVLESSQEHIKICSPIIMACFLGDAYFVEWNADNISDEEKGNLFKLVVERDRGECLKVLINSLYFNTNISEMVDNIQVVRLFLQTDLLEQACNKIKLKALEVLLAQDYFKLNAINNGNTLLDKYVELVEENDMYKGVVLLLKKYGAKTAVELEEIDRDEKEILSKLFMCSGCTIL